MILSVSNIIGGGGGGGGGHHASPHPFIQQNCIVELGGVILWWMNK